MEGIVGQVGQGDNLREDVVLGCCHVQPRGRQVQGQDGKLGVAAAGGDLAGQQRCHAEVAGVAPVGGEGVVDVAEGVGVHAGAAGAGVKQDGRRNHALGPELAAGDQHRDLLVAQRVARQRGHVPGDVDELPADIHRLVGVEREDALVDDREGHGLGGGVDAVAGRDADRVVARAVAHQANRAGVAGVGGDEAHGHVVQYHNIRVGDGVAFTVQVGYAGLDHADSDGRAGAVEWRDSTARGRSPRQHRLESGQLAGGVDKSVRIVRRSTAGRQMQREVVLDLEAIVGDHQRVVGLDILVNAVARVDDRLERVQPRREIRRPVQYEGLAGIALQVRQLLDGDLHVIQVQGEDRVVLRRNHRLVADGAQEAHRIAVGDARRQPLHVADDQVGVQDADGRDVGGDQVVGLVALDYDVFLVHHYLGGVRARGGPSLQGNGLRRVAGQVRDLAGAEELAVQVEVDLELVLNGRGAQVADGHRHVEARAVGQHRLARQHCDALERQVGESQLQLGQCQREIVVGLIALRDVTDGGVRLRPQSHHAALRGELEAQFLAFSHHQLGHVDAGDGGAVGVQVHPEVKGVGRAVVADRGMGDERLLAADVA